MTPQERELLDRFLTDLNRARPATKDAEAADQIERALRANPDAAYVLVQHAILADQALADAQARIDELERGGPPQQGGGSFLGGAGYPPGGYASGGYGPGPGAGTAVPPTGAGGFGGPFGGGGPFGAGGPPPGPFSGGGGLGGFLRSAGTTAAGVAGGAFLFEGLSSLFGGHHGGGGGGGYGFGDFGGGQNVTVNEYGDGGSDRFADTGGDSDTGGDLDWDDSAV